MKTLTIRIIFLVMVTGFLSGCKSRQAVLTFKTYATNTTTAQLIFNGDTLISPYDTIRGAVFTIKEPVAGYASLQMENLKKMIFLKPGDNMTIQYLRPGEAKSRYSFTGEGAAENEFLDTHERTTIIIRQDMNEKDVMQNIQNSITEVCRELDSLPLAESFKAIERERLEYQRLCRIFSYRQWTKELVPFLEEKMQAKPELLLTEDYRNFMNNALYFVAWHEASEHDLFHVAQSQMNYIDHHFQEPQVVDFLMENVMINYITWRGAEQIDPLMDIFCKRVFSPALREKIKKEYEEWSRVLKGKSIPEFTFLDINGKEIALSSFKGKYVYIDCWATWCGPCRAQIPHLKKLEQQYSGKDIVFVSISSDSDSKKWKNAVKEEALKGVQLIEKCPTNSELSEHFIIKGIPRFILLDKEGKVYDANAPRPSDPNIIKLFNELL